MSVFTSTSQMTNNSNIKNRGNIMNGDPTEKIYSGSRYLGARRGESAFLDGDQADKEYQKKLAKMGPGGFYVSLKNANKEAVPNFIYNMDGKAYRADDNGDLYLADENWMNEKLKEVEEIESYVTKLMKMCKTDELGMKLLGLSRREFVELCKGVDGTGTHPRFSDSTDGSDGKIYCPNECARVNCLPSMLTLYPPQSQLESYAFCKLRAILTAYMPAVKPASETKPHASTHHEAPTIPNARPPPTGPTGAAAPTA